MASVLQNEGSSDCRLEEVVRLSINYSNPHFFFAVRSRDLVCKDTFSLQTRHVWCALCWQVCVCSLPRDRPDCPQNALLLHRLPTKTMTTLTMMWWLPVCSNIDFSSPPALGGGKIKIWYLQVTKNFPLKFYESLLKNLFHINNFTKMPFQNIPKVQNPSRKKNPASHWWKITHGHKFFTPTIFPAPTQHTLFSAPQLQSLPVLRPLPVRFGALWSPPHPSKEDLFTIFHATPSK